MKKVFPVLFLMALAATLAAAQQLAAAHAPTAPPPAVSSYPAFLRKPVVKVNGAVLTELDLREQEQRLFPYYSIHGGKVPDKYQAEIRRKALDQIVVEELVYQEAQRRGMKVPAATLRQMLQAARGRFPTRQAYEAYAEQMYGSAGELERRIRRGALIEQFEHQQIELKAKVTDATVREVYEKNKPSFLRPESVWLQTISVQLPDNPSADQKKLALTRIQQILPQAQSAKNYSEFGLLAERVSEDEYRVNMGDHKWVHLVSLPAEIAKPLANLQAGQISGIVEARFGYVILRVNERRPAKQLTYDEVKDELRKEIEDANAQRRWTALQTELKKSAHIENL